MEFSDRHVVVTGGTGALGHAVVELLTNHGAHCHVPYIQAGEAERFALRDHPRVRLFEVASLTQETDVARCYADVATAGPLWGSVHLAGGFAMATIAETDQAALMQQFDTNAVTAFLCCRAAIAAMRDNGRGGRIVNVAARPGLEWRNGAGMAAYAMSKAAVAALTVALSEEVASDGILVNAVAPSILNTAANRAAMPKADHANWPTPAEVASTILFLVSPENRVTRGAVVPVYGRA